MRSIVLPARLDALYDAIAFVEGETKDVSGGGINQIEVAVEEIFVNICSYAYPDGEGEVEILCDAADGKLTLCFIDEGIPFDATKHKGPEIDTPVEERTPGGMGIYLVRQYMDKISYRREGTKNIFTMEKKMDEKDNRKKR